MLQVYNIKKLIVFKLTCDIKDLGFTFDKPEAFFFYNWFLCLLTI